MVTSAVPRIRCGGRCGTPHIPRQTAATDNASSQRKDSTENKDHPHHTSPHALTDKASYEPSALTLLLSQTHRLTDNSHTSAEAHGPLRKGRGWHTSTPSHLPRLPSSPAAKASVTEAGPGPHGGSPRPGGRCPKGGGRPGSLWPWHPTAPPRPEAWKPLGTHVVEETRCPAHRTGLPLPGDLLARGAGRPVCGPEVALRPGSGGGPQGEWEAASSWDRVLARPGMEAGGAQAGQGRGFVGRS